MRAWWCELRYVVRALGRRPLYSVLTIVVFALAIGATTTVFSVFNALYLRQLPYLDGDRLVMVYDSLPKIGVDDAGTSVPSYLDRRTQAPSLESLAIVMPSQRTLAGEETPEHIDVARVSPSLFQVLRVEPLLGRAFGEDEAVPGQDRVVVLSNRLWRTRFGGRAGIVGQDVMLDGEPFRVVGVLPPEATFPDATIDLWEPLAITPEMASDEQRGTTNAMSLGRLAPGATVEGLKAELDTIIARMLERLPAGASFVEATGFTGGVRPLRDWSVGDEKPLVLTLQGIVLTVLLIACANIANLQLSRLAARRRELSVRAALGADRARLMRLVLAESVVLALVGGAGGLASAFFGIDGLRALGLDWTEAGFPMVVDPLVVSFAGLAALCSAVLAAALPLALIAGRDGGGLLQPHARAIGGALPRVRGALVVLQVAISIALLTGAGLLTKSFVALADRGPGFRTDNLWTGGVVLSGARYSSDESRAVFLEEVLRELDALPGVVAASLTNALPFGGGGIEATLDVEGREAPAGAPPPVAGVRTISDAYFEALDVPLLKGREFAASEAEPVVIVNETLASSFWPNGDALGQRVRQGERGPWSTIVGVVPELKEYKLTDESDLTVYRHYRQWPPTSPALALSSAVPPEQLTLAVRATIARLDPTLAVHDIMPMQARVERSLGPQRTPMALLLAFAAVAATLAIVGVYGVLTWAVTQRVGEIGVRMALGARAADIGRMILRQGGTLIAIGLVLGVAGALGLGRVLSSQLERVGSFDATVLALTVIGLGGAALVASWLPARRAARVDPMHALRSE